LKPQDQWPNPNKPRDELIAEVQKAAAGVPGSNYELSQPIQLRFNELISGVRSDVAVKVFGDDMDALNSTANKIAASLKAVPGSSEVKVE
ncbi:efflux RND transporter permease subunit, partial [Streptomyces sp. IBSBF 2953]|nr:efflux RND transporter permease subunit [Streptomyces hayashii]